MSWTAIDSASTWSSTLGCRRYAPTASPRRRTRQPHRVPCQRAGRQARTSVSTQKAASVAAPATAAAAISLRRRPGSTCCAQPARPATPSTAMATSPSTRSMPTDATASLPRDVRDATS